MQAGTKRARTTRAAGLRTGAAGWSRRRPGVEGGASGLAARRACLRVPRPRHLRGIPEDRSRRREPARSLL